MITVEENNLRIEHFVNENLKYCKDANKEVLYFIADFYYANGKTDEEAESLRKQFRAGYCYHFATILKDIFQRGEICWCAPISHIVWCDDDGTPYDIEGVNFSECEEYIPVSFIGDSLKGFMHVRSFRDIPMRDAQELMNEYRESKKDSFLSGVNYIKN